MIGADKLMPGKFYHIYNRTNGKENLFRNDGDRKFFMKNIKKYLSPIMDVYAYCLMRNHFHLLVKITSKDELEQVKLLHYSKKFKCYNAMQVDLLMKIFNFPDNNSFISQQFSNLFDSYSKTFNLKHQRDGNLFQRSYHRKIVKEKDYLKYLFFYIHVNPIRDSPDMDFWDSSWNSFKEIVKGNDRYVNPQSVMAFFGNINGFKDYHDGMLRNVRNRNNWIELRAKKCRNVI